MATSRNKNGFLVEDMNGTDRALLDILDSARRPDGYCTTLLDFSYAEAFRKARVEQTGVPLTLIDVTLRAMAVTAVSNEAMRIMVEGYRRYFSDTMDIGCLVATSTNVAPIIVFRSIDKLSLEEIYNQRIAMLQEARAEEEKRLADLARMTRYLPDRVRRTLIRRFVSNPWERKKLSGTIQLTTIQLDDMECMFPGHVGGPLVLAMGKIKERPMVIDGQVVPRLSANVTFAIDQRIIHPMRAMRVFRRFRRVIENPEKLG